MVVFMGELAASKASFNEAIELINSGERTRAEQICRKAVQNNPDDVNMTAFLGALLFKSGDTEKTPAKVRAWRLNALSTSPLLLRSPMVWIKPKVTTP
jgi:hypothetical protein